MHGIYLFSRSFEDFPLIWLMDVDGQNLASILYSLLDSKPIKLPRCQKKDFISSAVNHDCPLDLGSKYMACSFH